MRVVLRGLKGEECVLGCINLDKWLESRVGLLGIGAFPGAHRT